MSRGAGDRSHRVGAVCPIDFAAKRSYAVLFAGIEYPHVPRGIPVSSEKTCPGREVWVIRRADDDAAALFNNRDSHPTPRLDQHRLPKPGIEIVSKSSFNAQGCLGTSLLCEGRPPSRADVRDAALITKRAQPASSAEPLFQLVEPTGIEPVTSTMPSEWPPMKPCAFSRNVLEEGRILPHPNAGFFPESCSIEQVGTTL